MKFLFKFFYALELEDSLSSIRVLSKMFTKSVGECKYEINATDERAAEASEVRTQAARQCVRQLRLHNVLSPAWLSLVDSLEQLSRLAQLESLMPLEGKVQEQKGISTDPVLTRVLI